MIIRMSQEMFDGFEYEHGKMEIGQIYTVLEKTNINTGDTWYVLIPGDTGGIEGNMDPTVKRYHGWRGTTNGIQVYAEGVRAVENIVTYKNGNRKITLGEDLKANVN